MVGCIVCALCKKQGTKGTTSPVDHYVLPEGFQLQSGCDRWHKSCPERRRLEKARQAPEAAQGILGRQKRAYKRHREQPAPLTSSRLRSGSNGSGGWQQPGQGAPTGGS
jgi:hypothetical protein